MSEHPTWQPIPAPLPVYDKPAPLDPTPATWQEQDEAGAVIAAMARAVLPELKTVLRYWTFADAYPLTGVRALVALLLIDEDNGR